MKTIEDEPWGLETLGFGWKKGRFSGPPRRFSRDIQGERAEVEPAHARELARLRGCLERPVAADDRGRLLHLRLENGFDAPEKP